MRVVVTGGGTGGHIYPALSIIEGLKSEYNDLDVVYIGTTNRMEAKMIPELGIEYIGLTMQGVNRKNLLKNFKLIYLLIKNFFVLRKFYKNMKPDIVIGTGGYVTVPVIYTASVMKIPTLIFDADKKFGMATRKLLKHADVICAGFSEPVISNSKAVFTGNPRSQYIFSKVNRETIRDEILFVFGSLGSETLNKFFIDYFNNTKLNYKVKYVTGKGMYEDFVTSLNNSNVDVVEYVEDVSKELSNVKFVVSRSGATFLSELEALAIPAIFIPSPYVANNEQENNITDIINDKLSFMIRENELSFENMNELINQMEVNYEKAVEGLKKRRKVDSLDTIISKVKELVNEWYK